MPQLMGGGGGLVGTVTADPTRGTRGRQLTDEERAEIIRRALLSRVTPERQVQVPQSLQPIVGDQALSYSDVLGSNNIEDLALLAAGGLAGRGLQAGANWALQGSVGMPSGEAIVRGIQEGVRRLGAEEVGAIGRGLVSKGLQSPATRAAARGMGDQLGIELAAARGLPQALASRGAAPIAQAAGGPFSGALTATARDAALAGAQAGPGLLGRLGQGVGNLAYTARHPLQSLAARTPGLLPHHISAVGAGAVGAGMLADIGTEVGQTVADMPSGATPQQAGPGPAMAPPGFPGAVPVAPAQAGGGGAVGGGMGGGLSPRARRMGASAYGFSRANYNLAARLRALQNLAVNEQMPLPHLLQLWDQVQQQYDYEKGFETQDIQMMLPTEQGGASPLGDLTSLATEGTRAEGMAGLLSAMAQTGEVDPQAAMAYLSGLYPESEGTAATGLSPLSPLFPDQEDLDALRTSLAQRIADGATPAEAINDEVDERVPSANSAAALEQQNVIRTAAAYILQQGQNRATPEGLAQQTGGGGGFGAATIGGAVGGGILGKLAPRLAPKMFTKPHGLIGALLAGYLANRFFGGE